MILYDKIIVEVLVNQGEVAMTVQIFPDEENEGIEVFSLGQPTRLQD